MRITVRVELSRFDLFPNCFYSIIAHFVFVVLLYLHADLRARAPMPHVSVPWLVSPCEDCAVTAAASSTKKSGRVDSST